MDVDVADEDMAIEIDMDTVTDRDTASTRIYMYQKVAD